MLKAIIIDDEANARTMLAELLQAYCENIEVVATESNVPDAVLAINQHHPDVIFLDIEMPNYNGFELLNFFKEITFEIVFVTAYSQYAVRAFEVSAVDYLLKPVEIDALVAAVEKVRIKRTHSNIAQRLELMKNAFDGEEIKKMALSLNDGMVFVEVKDMMFIEADRSYSHIFLKDGSKITVSKPMRVFEDLLDQKRYFFRPHRSYLININYIKKYNRAKSLIDMDNGVQVAVSRERKLEFDTLLRELKMFV